MKSDYGKPIPLRLSDDTLEKIQLVARHTGKTQQEVIRLAMEVGLEDLKRCNYDIAGAIVDRAKSPEKELALVAEPKKKTESLRTTDEGGGYTVKKAKCAIMRLSIPTTFYVLQRKGK